MDFKTLLTNRRSIRNYRDQAVPLPVLREILQECTLAPTASNGQPCRFVVIGDRAMMKRLSDASKGSLLADITANPDLPQKRYEEALRDGAFNVFYNAPCLIFIVGSPEVSSLAIDCSLTAAYLMFSAVSRGLGTCWIGLGSHVRDRELLREIGVPEDCRIVAPIILGYPAEIPPASERHAPDVLSVI